MDIAFYYHKGVIDGEQKAIRQAKHRLRKAKEKSAHEGFFEDSYVRGFDSTGALFYRGAKVPTQAALEYYKIMDELADTEIFTSTERI